MSNASIDSFGLQVLPWECMENLRLGMKADVRKEGKAKDAEAGAATRWGTRPGNWKKPATATPRRDRRCQTQVSTVAGKAMTTPGRSWASLRGTLVKPIRADLRSPGLARRR